ncbi:MAG: hypothetical protein Q9166_007955 [cf. Caloplaca sp. 2 TL-2023]
MVFKSVGRYAAAKLYKELFALCQALPGPGSTKMIYCINVIHGGFTAGVLSFFIWSLPAAIAAYGLSLGIASIDERLPAPVYALLTGLNAATVGIIALAAVQLSQKAITDKLTRILVFLGGTAGMLYNALWYFPVLMVLGGASTVVWDYRWGHTLLKRIRRRPRPTAADTEAHTAPLEMQEFTPEGPIRRTRQTPSSLDQASTGESNDVQTTDQERTVPEQLTMRVLSWKHGAMIIASFFVSFIVIMALRGAASIDQRGFNLFANLYLAVAVYLGSLAAASSSDLPSAAGAVIGYIAIFAPGLILHTGCMGLWKTLRGYRWFTSCLRGVNASAVGLVYTAVYRLWEIGYIDEAYQSGSSLGRDPWWVVITATSFVGGMWFKLPAPAAILLGGVMGMIWFGVVKA